MEHNPVTLNYCHVTKWTI